MKRTKIDLSEERQILIYMITSTPFLRQLHGIAKPQLFQSNYSRIISTWIWDYWSNIEKSPGKDIQDLYVRNRSQIPEEEDLELVSDFLQNLSNEHKNQELNNVTYAVQNAVNYFKLRSLEHLKDKIENCIIDKTPQIGEKIIAEYTRVEKPHGSGIDLFRDANDIISAFDNEEEYLFSYPGELGKIIGPFMRGDFLGILGAMKRGKSFWLWYTARRAALMGLKSIFFSLEMTKNEILRRGWQSFVGEPRKGGVIKIPEFVESSGGLWEINHRSQNYKGVDPSQIKEQQKKYRKELRTEELRVELYPSYSTALNDIQNCLYNLEYYDKFVPDVIVVDYADILLPEMKGDYRHQLNQIWAKLRGWAQERNCMVATGSQSSKKGLEKDSKAGDVAEDVRKLGHVTKMFSLNQTDKEMQDGVLRVESLMNRDYRTSKEQVVVLECREISRIYLDSRLKKDVLEYQKNEKSLESKV